ncbi:MAG: hypothetical protein KGL39_40090 [Patescibacteria group bacterium]|nr:hypothetical protein [Patescibacteria group bacterium]
MNLDIDKLDVAVALHAELSRFLKEHKKALLVESGTRAFPTWKPMSRFAVHAALGTVIGVADRTTTPQDIYHMVFA